MGSEAATEAATEASSTPKLSLFSLPNQSPEPHGMLTPPLRPPATVPFLWEEAPGKPRTCSSGSTEPKSSSARCLELPPRLLLGECRITNMPSPTTVLEGPYGVVRSASCSFSRDRRRICGSPEKGAPQVVVLSSNKEQKSGGGGGGYFGSWGRRSLRQGGGGNGGGEVVGEGNMVLSRSATTTTCCSSSSAGAVFGVSSDDGEGEGGDQSCTTTTTTTKVKITRVRRKRSFFHHSNTKSHFWASIYGSFKQVVVVPWRSRKT